MHNENERYDDVFIIVIVFILVRNLPITEMVNLEEDIL
jgi:hypothetical protein